MLVGSLKKQKNYYRMVLKTVPYLEANRTEWLKPGSLVTVSILGYCNGPVFTGSYRSPRF